MKCRNVWEMMVFWDEWLVVLAMEIEIAMRT
jgi:hypothetical protein